MFHRSPLTQCNTVQVASFSSARYVLEFLQQPLTQHWETAFIEVRWLLRLSIRRLFGSYMLVNCHDRLAVRRAA